MAFVIGKIVAECTGFVKDDFFKSRLTDYPL